MLETHCLLGVGKTQDYKQLDLDVLSTLSLKVSPACACAVPSMPASRNELRHALETVCLQCIAELLCC